MMNLKGRQYNTLLLYLRIWNAISTEIACGCLKNKTSPRPNTIMLILFPEYAAQIQFACGFNCGYCPEEFHSMSPPHPWSVSVGCLLIVHTETTQCSIGPVALSSCNVQIRLKIFLQVLQYHELTASLWLVVCCILFWVRKIQLTCYCQNIYGNF
jgi:hypothetical protein